MKIFRLFFLLLFILVFLLNRNDASNTDDILLMAKDMIQKAENTWDYEGFLKVRSLLKESKISDSQLYLSHYYIALANYRLAIYQIRKKEKKKSLEFINDGMENLKMSIKLREDFSESHALLGSFMGLKISVSWYLGPFLGPKSFKSIEKAIELDPNNPRAYLIRGISYFSTPSLFGGGLSKAIKDFEKSINLFDQEKKEGSVEPSWGLGEAYTWLGLCYMKKGEKGKAEEIFLEGISKCPDFDWLRTNLERLKKSPEEEKK